MRDNILIQVFFIKNKKTACIPLSVDLGPVHTVDRNTVTPALRQTVTAISTTNSRCPIFKRDSFNIKVHVVYKILALVLAIISLLDQQQKKNTFTFTPSRSGGDSLRVHCVYNH